MRPIGLFCALVTILIVLEEQWARACQDRIYVGGSNGEFAISYDGGETWTQRYVQTGEKINTIVELDNGNILLGSPRGMYKTKNGGHTWSLSWSGQSVSFFNANGSNVSFLYYYDDSYIKKSKDSGETWPTSVNPPYPCTGKMYYREGGTDYVGCGSYLQYSSDNFAHYSQIDQTSGLAGGNVGAIIVVDGTIYVGMSGDGTPVSISDDNFATWGTTYITPHGSNGAVLGFANVNGIFYAIVEGVGVAFTRDPWSTWSIKNTTDGLASNSIVQLTASSNGCIYATSPNGLSISRDGGQTWIKKTTQDGLPTNNLVAVFAKAVEVTTTASGAV